MCFILVQVGLRSVLMLLEKACMGEDGVQLNSYDFVKVGAWLTIVMAATAVVLLAL